MEAAVDGLLGTALILNKEPVGTLVLFGCNLCQPLRLHILAAKSHRKHRAHIGMADEADDLIDGVLVVGTAVKAHQLHIITAAAFHDLPRHMFGAFDGVDHKQAVADAFFSVLPGITEPGAFHDVIHILCPSVLRS